MRCNCPYVVCKYHGNCAACIAHNRETGDMAHCMEKVAMERGAKMPLRMPEKVYLEQDFEAMSRRSAELVCDVIRQHHGKSLVGYFIRKAQQLAILSGDEALVDESNYRYDGPRPQTMEAAILMLCDIVEASSRSLKKVTQQAVEDLVEKLVYERVKDGELSDCPITLRQIEVIRKSLVNSVLMSYHKRISYADADKEKPPVAASVGEVGQAPQIRMLGKDVFRKEETPKAEENSEISKP